LGETTSAVVQHMNLSITMEPIEKASAVRGGVVTSGDLLPTPLAARSFANIAYLVHGTEPVEPSDPIKSSHHCCLYPSSSVASVSGLILTAGGIGTILSTFLISSILDRYSFKPAFLTASLAPPVGPGLLFLLIRNRSLETERS
jgi:MFS family permease